MPPAAPPAGAIRASMKALPKRKGNDVRDQSAPVPLSASMKALPKRKGNLPASRRSVRQSSRLNESPSKKEGKY